MFVLKVHSVTEFVIHILKRSYVKELQELDTAIRLARYKQAQYQVRSKSLPSFFYKIITSIAILLVGLAVAYFEKPIMYTAIGGIIATSLIVFAILKYLICFP